jgi:hypothetical protein
MHYQFVIQSIFGSIKNYWTSRKSSDDKEKEKIPDRSPRSVSMDASTPRSRRQLQSAIERASTNVDVDEHPGRIVPCSLPIKYLRT